MTSWLRVTVSAPPHGELPLLVDALRGLGALQVERDGARLSCLFPTPRDAPALAARVAFEVRANTSVQDPAPLFQLDDGSAWAERWHRDFEPRRVSRRIRVAAAAPAGVETAVAGPTAGASAEAVVRLVPGLGFGTAGHATTRSTLRLLDRLLEPGHRIADVGAGSAILSIAAALLGARRVVAYEMDASACATARANIAANGVENRVVLREATVGPGSLGWIPRYDGILANIAAGTLVRLIPGLRRALTPGGWLVLSGAARSDRDRMLKAAAAARLTPGMEEAEDGWWTGAFTRPERAFLRLRS